MSRSAIHDFRLPWSLQFDETVQKSENLWEAQKPVKNRVRLGQFRD